MLCKLCNTDRKLIAAHIIPRSFFEISSVGPLRIASNTHGVFPKRAPAGIYDTQLLCEECERLFSRFDDYAHRLLLVQRDASRAILDKGRPIAYAYPTYDYATLKLFFIGLLWRISQSSHDFFKSFNLGKHEPAVRQAVWTADPGASDFYAVALAKFPHPLGILNPVRCRLFEVNFCMIYLAEYVAYVKVDRRRTPEPIKHFILSRDAPLVLLGRDPTITKDVSVMRHIAMKAIRFHVRDH